MELCSTLLMVFRQNLFKIFFKFRYLSPKLRYLIPILQKLRVTHNLGCWLVGNPMVNILFALTELSLLTITVPEL